MKDEIYVVDAASQSEALRLGAELKAAGYMTDREATVRFSETRDGKTVGFVLADGEWDRPEVVARLTEIGNKIAPAFGPFPFTIDLLNNQMKPKKSVVIESQYRK